MKSDKSVRNITLAAINRKVMDPNSWIHSRIADENDQELIRKFQLIDSELSVFEIKSENAHTLISTRRIMELSNHQMKELNFENIDDLIYGNFKGTSNAPILSKFRTVDIYGEELDFQLETGKASIGLIYAISTIRSLRLNDLNTST